MPLLVFASNESHPFGSSRVETLCIETKPEASVNRWLHSQSIVCCVSFKTQKWRSLVVLFVVLPFAPFRLSCCSSVCCRRRRRSQMEPTGGPTNVSPSASADHRPASIYLDRSVVISEGRTAGRPSTAPCNRRRWVLPNDALWYLNDEMSSSNNQTISRRPFKISIRSARESGRGRVQLAF